MIKIGMIIGDRYEIQEKIGTGGMSDVYRSLDHKLNRPVAVKVLKAEFSENQNFVAKFRTEAQAAAGLMHPNIVNVYDVGNDKGIYYIVMELVDGITLKKYIEKKSRLTVREAVSIGIQVAMGLDAAHKNGIVHRDIKPQNIIISKDGKVKVTDFGIAKAASSNTITTNVMGSVHYTSPEQARGGFSDAKSDIYSLGITLFEMVTGRVPYNGDTTVAIAIKHIQEPFPSPKEYAPDLPISVEKIILKCCQKSPDRRYQSATELIKDLKKSLITPDEDFVVLVDPDEEGATRIATDGEHELIRHSSTGSISHTEQMRLRDAVEKNYQSSDKADECTNAKTSNNRYNEGSSQKNNKSSETNYDNDKSLYKKNSKESDLDKLMIIMAVIAVIMISVIIIFAISRSFLSSSSEEASSVSSASTSESGIIVPNVIGMSYIEAKTTLQDKGFVVEKIDDNASTEPKNVVTGQSTDAGDRLESGSTISINVSTGKADASLDASEDSSSSASASTSEEEEKVTMPSVVGMDEAEARLTLVNMGFSNANINVIEVNNDDTSLVDTIIKQTPTAGTSVSVSSTISLELSIGPETSSTLYYYSGTIEAPTEDPYYTSGTTVSITLTASDGTALLSTATSSFPYTVQTISNIAASTGTLEMNFVVTIPITTDETTGTQTGGTTQTRTVTRTITFTPQS